MTFDLGLPFEDWLAEQRDLASQVEQLTERRDHLPDGRIVTALIRAYEQDPVRVEAVKTLPEPNRQRLMLTIPCREAPWDLEGATGGAPTSGTTASTTGTTSAAARRRPSLAPGSRTVTRGPRASSQR